MLKYLGFALLMASLGGGIAVAETKLENSASFRESTKPAAYIIGKDCQTTAKFPPDAPKATPCQSVRVTGLDDPSSNLYFHFTDEFGTGLVFVTERFGKSGKIAKIVAIGSVIDNKVTKLTAIELTGSSCLVNYGGKKVACLLNHPEMVLIGQLDDY
jgi:hypothetical protein